MKRYTLAAGLILGTASAMGQVPRISPVSQERPCISSTAHYATANLAQAKKNFLWTLQSDNDGVVESALAHVAQMRILVPNEDMRDIEVALAQLSNNGRTPVIRYKGYLATQVFASPALFARAAAVDYASGDDFFAAVALRLQQTMLGYRSK